MGDWNFYYSAVLLNSDNPTSILLETGNYQTSFYRSLFQAFRFIFKTLFYKEKWYQSEITSLPCPSEYGRQNFAFPKDVMNRILSLMNHKIYKKFIQTCKYFYFIKQKLIVEKFECGKMSDLYALNVHSNYSKPLKIWITKKLYVTPNEKNEFADFIPRIYRCDAISIIISNSNLTENEFNQCINPNTVETLYLNEIIIHKTDSNFMTIEEIISKIPNAKYIKLYGMQFSPESGENLAALKRNKKIKFFMSSFAPETFNIIAYCEFIQKNATFGSKFALYFDLNTNSERLKNAKNELRNLEDSWKAKSHPSKPLSYFRCTNNFDDFEFKQLFKNGFYF